MFGKVVRSFAKERRGRAFVAGVIGVLTAVECALSTRVAKSVPVKRVPVIDPPVPPHDSRLKIARTQSELGYAYWVLRETGANPSYALFDTWREAMDEAVRRISVAAKAAPEPHFALITA
jgi:hypothetical protein